MPFDEKIVLAPVPRHPLGLPQGSVRAVLSLTIVGLLWLLLLLPADKDVQVPLYLYFLLGLVLVFFGSHGRSIAPQGTNRSPLGLPRGSIRGIIVLGTVAVFAWCFHSNPSLLMARLTPTPEQLPQWPYLLMVLLGGFLLGWIIRLGPWKNLYWFQDVQAWFSLVAIILLGAEMVIRLFIRPHMEEELDLPVVEEILVGVVAFYFGVRC
jgi:uncharacterized membrane protein